MFNNLSYGTREEIDSHFLKILDGGLNKEPSFVDKVARLTERAAEGDRAAYGALVKVVQQPLFRRIYVQLGEQEEAEDVLQEVLVQAWRSLPRLRDHQAAWAWLCQMTYNLTRDHRRKRKRVRKEGPLVLSSETKAFLESMGGTQTINPEKQMLSAELSRLVNAAIQSLKEKYQEVLLLREFGQFSYQEISEMLGCSSSAVESRLHRARIKLKVQLEKLLKKP